MPFSQCQLSIWFSKLIGILRWTILRTFCDILVGEADSMELMQKWNEHNMAHAIRDVD